MMMRYSMKPMPQNPYDKKSSVRAVVAEEPGTSATRTSGTMMLTTGGMNQPPLTASGAIWTRRNSERAKARLTTNASGTPIQASTSTISRTVETENHVGPTVALAAASTRMPPGTVP